MDKKYFYLLIKVEYEGILLSARDNNILGEHIDTCVTFIEGDADDKKIENTIQELKKRYEDGGYKNFRVKQIKKVEIKDGLKLLFRDTN